MDDLDDLDDFFNNGVTAAVLKHLGTVDDSRDKLIRVIIGKRTLMHSFSRKVGIASKMHDFDADDVITLLTNSSVTRSKDESFSSDSRQVKRYLLNYLV